MSTSYYRPLLWLHVFSYMIGQWTTAQQNSGTQQFCTMVCPVSEFVCVVRTLTCNATVCPTLSECVQGDPANNCSSISCPSGSQCVYVLQTCTTSPCYPRPQCTSQGSSNTSTSTATTSSTSSSIFTTSSTMPGTQSVTSSQSSSSTTSPTTIRPTSTIPYYVLPPEVINPPQTVMGSRPSNVVPSSGSSMIIQSPARPSPSNTTYVSPSRPSNSASPSQTNSMSIQPPARPSSSYAISSRTASRSDSPYSLLYNRIPQRYWIRHSLSNVGKPPHPYFPIPPPIQSTTTTQATTTTDNRKLESSKDSQSLAKTQQRDKTIVEDTRTKQIVLGDPCAYIECSAGLECRDMGKNTVACVATPKSNGIDTTLAKLSDDQLELRTLQRLLYDPCLRVVCQKGFSCVPYNSGVTRCERDIVVVNQSPPQNIRPVLQSIISGLQAYIDLIRCLINPNSPVCTKRQTTTKRPTTATTRRAPTRSTTKPPYSSLNPCEKAVCIPPAICLTINGLTGCFTGAIPIGSAGISG